MIKKLSFVNIMEETDVECMYKTVVTLGLEH